MRIGDLAKLSGVAASAIRFYESKGLLKSIPRKSNGYREYPDDAVFLLTIITNAQQAGFSLDEIKQILPPTLSNWQHDKLVNVLTKKIEDVEKLEQKLKDSKASLKKILKAVQEKPADLACADNAKQLLKKLTKKSADKALK